MYLMNVFILIKFLIVWGQRSWVPRPNSNTKSKARAEEQEMAEDRWKEPRPPDRMTEDSLILGRPQAWESKTPCHPRWSIRGSQGRF